MYEHQKAMMAQQSFAGAAAYAAREAAAPQNSLGTQPQGPTQAILLDIRDRLDDLNRLCMQLADRLSFVSAVDSSLPTTKEPAKEPASDMTGIPIVDSLQEVSRKILFAQQQVRRMHEELRI